MRRRYHGLDCDTAAVRTASRRTEAEHKSINRGARPPRRHIRNVTKRAGRQERARLWPRHDLEAPPAGALPSLRFSSAQARHRHRTDHRWKRGNNATCRCPAQLYHRPVRSHSSRQCPSCIESLFASTTAAKKVVYIALSRIPIPYHEELPQCMHACFRTRGLLPCGRNLARRRDGADREHRGRRAPRFAPQSLRAPPRPSRTAAWGASTRASTSIPRHASP